MPPPESSQWGYRGTGMEGLYDPDRLQDVADNNVVPDAIPAVPAVGPKASDIYKNVQVLGDPLRRRIHTSDGRGYTMGLSRGGLQLLPRRG